MHVVYAIDNLGTGGAQRQAAELALHLTREFGIRVTVLTYRDVDFHGERLREAGVPVILLPKRGKADPWFPRRIRQWLRDHRPDVVNAFLVIPGLWYSLAVRPLSPEERPVFIAAERSAFRELSFPLDPARCLVYRRADAVTVNSEIVVHEVQERLGVAPERIAYLPNGIDLAAWDRAAEEPCPLDFEPGCLHLALIGGVRRVKNHGVVLNALELLGHERTRNWRVWFVGTELDEPEHARRIRSRIERAPGLAEVVRMVPPLRNVVALLRQLDGILLPSAFEGFPNVLLEAMASGVPGIASRVGDVPNMIESGKNGFVIGRPKPEILAAALAELSHEGRTAMRIRARRAVEERYAMPVVARRHLELYRRLALASAQWRRNHSTVRSRPSSKFTTGS